MTFAALSAPTCVCASECRLARPATARSTGSPSGHQRIAGAAWREGRSRRPESRHTRDEFGSVLKLAAEQLRVCAVGDAQPQVDGLQLLIDVQPRARPGLDRRQRREQRIDRLRALGVGSWSTWLLDWTRRLRTFERARVDAPLFHASDELRLLVRRHRLESLEHAGLKLRGIAPAATAEPAATAAAGILRRSWCGALR